MKIKVFLPCRLGSQRVKDKNTRKFNEKKNGLLGIKIEQLIKLKSIDKIILSTNDQKVIKIANSFKNKKISIDIRPDNLCSNKTRTDDLIKYVGKIFSPDDHILWTHVTCPFFDTEEYNKSIKLYKKNIKKYDTLVGANIIKDFIFNYKNPINYNFKKTFWPNTQNLKPLYKINNTIFLTSCHNYLKFNNRIGKKIFFYEVKKQKSIDIDYIDDFLIAEKIYSLS